MKTIKNTLFMGTLLVALATMLVGCTEAQLNELNGEVSADTDEVETVNLGDVESEETEIISEEYFLMMSLLISDNIDFSSDITQKRNAMLEDYVMDATEKDDLNSTLDEYAVFLKGLNEMPSTDLEFKLDKLKTEIVYHGENRIDYTREYLNTEDSMYNKLAKEEYQKWEDSMNGLLNELELNNLFAN